MTGFSSVQLGLGLSDPLGSLWVALNASPQKFAHSVECSQGNGIMTASLGGAKTHFKVRRGTGERRGGGGEEERGWGEERAGGWWSSSQDGWWCQAR